MVSSRGGNACEAVLSERFRLSNLWTAYHLGVQPLLILLLGTYGLLYYKSNPNLGNLTHEKFDSSLLASQPYERNIMDLLDMMKFESGEMSLEEIVELLSEFLKIGNIDNQSDRIRTLANKYINKGILDEEGNINYIKLNQEE